MSCLRVFAVYRAYLYGQTALKSRVQGHCCRLTNKKVSPAFVKAAETEGSAFGSSPHAAKLFVDYEIKICDSVLCHDVGINGLIADATVLIGIVWRTILPGPVTTVLKIPSPPNRAFLTPGTVWISILHVDDIAET